MNPRLVKFAVELQTGDVEVKTTKEIKFQYSTKRFFDFLKEAKATVAIKDFL